MRKTKIICTLGPAVDEYETLKALVENGMDCARFNFSHGKHEDHLERMEKVRKIREELGRPIAILLDTKGPEIRLRDFENGSIEVEKGQTFTLKAGEGLGTQSYAYLTYPNLAQSVPVGATILVDDGKVAMEVVRIDGCDIVCEIRNNGRMSNHKSINIPNIPVDMPYMSEADRQDLLFGIAQKVDYVAASFVRTADDIRELRGFLLGNGGHDIKIISKIENTQGLLHLDEIISVSDGIMVARGDMGVEVEFQRLPAIQKEMIHKCYLAGKIVVTATQMLESMTYSPRPTRAEVTDVANAVYDGTTAIMLSGESAAGDYPVECVHTMALIAEAAESGINYEKLYHQNDLKIGTDVCNAVANASCSAAFDLNAKALVVMSKSGKSAQLIAAHRPQCPIIAATVNETACRQLNLVYGVYPIAAEEQFTTDHLLQHAMEKALETGLVKKGDLIVIVSGSVIGTNQTDLIQVHRL